ncbi:hypothetical protein A2118_02910 [Candidatus Kaiserbacteria bacterium GWA2_50_9]|uniref:Uncharacterized protein n=1 Tax=Candidatus Kaiserbacteria bacterium GWA2_50_9 TaxID=1798474 RepID=A0A1F6BU47_9BACT|nr:MAG: hypothetical protein A2118_02910 [Candidatus Kaiserbacteria bacterium GWA2_50_9]
MGILQALGFGLFLAMLLFFAPTVFSELVRTTLVFLRSSQDVLVVIGAFASYITGLISSYTH